MSISPSSIRQQKGKDSSPPPCNNTESTAPPLTPVVVLFAVVARIALTSSGERLRFFFADSRRATEPAVRSVGAHDQHRLRRGWKKRRTKGGNAQTKGQAIDVPLITPTPPWFTGKVERMFPPGAVRDG
jgi:hypothetical protein